MSWQEDFQADDARALREQADAVLGDLARRWQVPPHEFCAALARALVYACCKEPCALKLLGREVGRHVAAALALKRLQTAGVRLRVDGRGTLRAGPPNALTAEVRATIHRHKAELLNILGGGT